MSSSDPEVIDVRPEERLDVGRLEPYLRTALDESGAFALRQFGGGHANLTYLVCFDEREYVLRRPPLGPVPTHAHDMRREHAVLSKLFVAYPLAPRSFHLCTDHAVIGADFVVEERKHGIAIRRDLPESLRENSGFAARLAEAFITALARLHSVDVSQTGLSELGRPEGYVSRQLEGWSSRFEAARTPTTSDAAPLIARLHERMPVSPAPALVHNDFKLDNMLFDPDDPARIRAVLDWDMCTYGDPLMDLGYVLALWPEPSDPPQFRAWGMPSWRNGFPSRRALIERYAELTGFDVSHAGWYHVFNIFRFAAILQQIYKRYADGQTHDERFARFGEQADGLVAVATFLAKTILDS